MDGMYTVQHQPIKPSRVWRVQYSHKYVVSLYRTYLSALLLWWGRVLSRDSTNAADVSCDARSPSTQNSIIGGAVILLHQNPIRKALRMYGKNMGKNDEEKNKKRRGILIHCIG